MADGVYVLAAKDGYGVIYLSRHSKYSRSTGEIAWDAYHSLGNRRVLKLPNILVKAGEWGRFKKPAIQENRFLTRPNQSKKFI